MQSLFLHRISVGRVYLSVAATTQDLAGQDPQQGGNEEPSGKAKGTFWKNLGLKCEE